MSSQSERNDNRPEQEEPVPTENLGAGAVGPGGRIGPYKLLSILGEGGYGVVYVAERLRPVKRRVALKIIKPGMDTKQVIARFEAERQALALLDHPNIAHVFNAGTTKAGRPYFVMEYVKGVPITEHCDLEKLSVEERLGLFLQVCEAVRHAHQKGIIHRDIKPSNILVSIEGEKAVPKIIDFGVAKAVTQPLTERTLYTEQGQFVGTPEYMSPEQAEMTTQDIDTRTDIYSLGVVLYELLTGTLPFDPKTLREGGVDHIRHIIREEDPKTPSTRLSTISGEESARVAELRRTDVRTLGRKLHGDLDWITVKAMEKDRMRRYETAHSLAEDIQRHLSHEPVLAGPPSKIYRMKKFLLKHRTQAVAATMIAALIVCVVVISVMYLRDRRRSKEAESLKHTDILSKAMELRSNGQFQEALTKVKAVLNSEHVGPKARLLRARLILELQGPAEAVKELEKLLDERDEIACQAHFLLARIYLEGDPGDRATTAEYQQKAKEHQQKGEKLFSESAEAYFNRSMMAGTANQTLEWLDKAVNFDPGHYDSREARALAYYALKDYDKMERDAEAVIVMRPNYSLGYSLRAIARREKAMTQGEKDLLSEGIRDHNKAIELSPDEPELYDQRRRTHMQMGNYEQALKDARKCVRLQPDEKVYHFHAFCALVAVGSYDDAKVVYDKIINSGLMTREYLDLSAAKYVSDTLDAGLSWHPPESRPEGAVFLAMHESAEIYQQLREKKARRVVPEGFVPTWSHDGTELAYSRGIHGFSGIEILNLASGKTRLLVVPGFDPAWSPDGEYIAFVRSRELLLLSEVTTEYGGEVAPYEQREVWIIKSSGRDEPRLLARGHWPCWSNDSRRVFYQSPSDMKVYSISLEDGAKPRPEVSCPGYYPVVSPDERYVAYGLVGELRAAELSTESVVESWIVPPMANAVFLNWSPNGQELSVAGGALANSGLWIYELGKKPGERKASKLLSGSFGMSSWSRPDVGKIAIQTTFGTLHREIWVAEVASLRPGRTIEEHCQEMVDYYSRRIKIDPQYKTEYLFLGRLLEDLSLRGIEHYRKGAYEEALTTLTRVDTLRQTVVGDKSRPRDLAYISMVLHELSRSQDARAALKRLGHLFEDGKNTDKLNYLCKAEQLFAGKNSKLYLVWEYIEAGKLEEASQRIEELRSLPSQGYADVATSIERAAKALAGAYYERGRNAKYSDGGYGDAIRDYEAAVGVDPNYARAFSDLAWLRAACPAAEFRDEAKAIKNAIKACDLTDWNDHRYVGTLAAVYAEAGDFDASTERQKQAANLLSEDDRARWQAIYESRLRLYQSRKPYRGGNLWSFSTGRMIGWWKFDEGRGSTALDSSGHSNHGTLRGDPQWVDGIIGGALELDGDDFLTIDGVVDDLTSNNITVSAWVKTTTSVEGNLFASNSSGEYHSFLFGIQNGRVYVSDDYVDEGHSSIAVNDGQWHMWSYVRRGSTGYIYVDVVQVSTHSAGFDLAVETQWSIGQEWDSSGPSDFLTGTVDDARIYNYALSETEIRALYNSRDSHTLQDL